MKLKKLFWITPLVAGILVLAWNWGESKSPSKPKAQTAEKAFLGVYLQDIDHDTRDALDLKDTQGALVEGVVDNSPAEKAGLEEQDVIITLDGQKIEDSGELREALAGHKPGDEVKLVVIREGNKKNISVELGESGDEIVFGAPLVEPGDVQSFSFSVPSFNRARLGVQISELSEQLGDYFGVPKGKGALITEVMGDSPAQKAGMKAGDVIVKIEEQKINGTSDVHEALADYKKGDKVNLEVIRDRKKQTYTVELEGPSAQWHADSWGNLAPKMKMKGDPKIKVFTDQNFGGGELRDELRDLKRQMEELKKELEELKQEQE